MTGATGRAGHARPTHFVLAVFRGFIHQIVNYEFVILSHGLCFDIFAH